VQVASAQESRQTPRELFIDVGLDLKIRIEMLIKVRRIKDCKADGKKTAFCTSQHPFAFQVSGKGSTAGGLSSPVSQPTYRKEWTNLFTHQSRFQKVSGYGSLNIGNSFSSAFSLPLSSPFIAEAWDWAGLLRRNSLKSSRGRRKRRKSVDHKACTAAKNPRLHFQANALQLHIRGRKATASFLWERVEGGIMSARGSRAFAVRRARKPLKLVYSMLGKFENVFLL